MEFLVGTSGYSYPAWKGSFYPQDLPAKKFLSYYSERYRAVESNYTFGRMPTREQLQSWGAQVPASFRFALKAPLVITHRKRLKDAAEVTKEFLSLAKGLKQRLGPILFQLPPNFKKDVALLKTFCKSLSTKGKFAFEFRHDSWFDDEVFDCLRARRVALCLADVDGKRPPQIVSTTDWGYVRLRAERYTMPQLRRWIQALQSQAWRECFVFFMHEDTGNGPKFADAFLDLARTS